MFNYCEECSDSMCSFLWIIGVELAAALADKAKSVSLVDLVEAPFQLALGKDVGNVVKKVSRRLVLQLMTRMRVMPIAY